MRHLLSPGLWLAHSGGAEGDSAPLPWRGGAPRAAHELFLEAVAADSGFIDPPSGLGNCFPARLAGQGRGARLDAVQLQRRQVRPVHADQDESLPRGCLGRRLRGGHRGGDRRGRRRGQGQGCPPNRPDKTVFCLLVCSVLCAQKLSFR